MTEVTPAIAQAAVIAARPAASAEVETAREFEAMFLVSDRGSDAQDGP
jgi:glucan phosphoethanolaminetransferase (alkaline phosphatase superfamily)